MKNAHYYAIVLLTCPLLFSGCAAQLKRAPAPAASVASGSEVGASAVIADARPVSRPTIDPKQMPVMAFPSPPPGYDLGGECYPIGNGQRIEPTTTYCGCKGTGKDFDANKHGDKVLFVITRENASWKWDVLAKWSVRPKTMILVKLATPDRRVFFEKKLTGSGMGMIFGSGFPGMQLFYVGWQAYPVP